MDSLVEDTLLQDISNNSMSYEEYTIKELKDICRKHNFKGYSTYKKCDLITFMNDKFKKIEDDFFTESKNNYHTKIEEDKILKHDQQNEYDVALKKDLENQIIDGYEEYKDIKNVQYSKPLDENEKNHMRMFRLKKFS